MTTKNLRSRCPILFVVALLLAAGGGVGQAEVRDNAGFFSEDAVRQANFDLKDVKQRHGKDLLIETHATVPANMRTQLQQLGENKFYAQWAAARATEAKIDGAAVLITKDPSHLHVVVGDRARQSGAFSTEDGGKLREQLVTNFREKQYDLGLLAAVRTFRETLTTNLGGASASPTVERAPAAAPSAQRSSNEPQANPGAFDPRGDNARNRGGGGGGISLFKLIIWGIVILIIIRVISRLFTRRHAQQQHQQPGGMFGGGGAFGRSRYGQQGNDPRYGGGGGMGGFGTGLGGGLLGGLLGGWLGGRMFGGGSSTAHGAPPPTSTGQEPGVFSNEHDAGIASSGGSFSDAGGADFGGGGGFSGGGDAGGGDF